MSANNFVITSHYFHNDIAISCAFHFHYPRKQLYFCCASIQVVAAFVLSASTLTLSFLPLIVIIVSSLSLLPPLCGTFAFVLQPIRFAICQCQMHVKIKKKLNFFNSQRFPIFCAFNTNMLCSVFGACQPFLSNDFLRVLFFIFFLYLTAAKCHILSRAHPAASMLSIQRRIDMNNFIAHINTYAQKEYSVYLCTPTPQISTSPVLISLCAFELPAGDFCAQSQLSPLLVLFYWIACNEFFDVRKLQQRIFRTFLVMLEISARLSTQRDITRLICKYLLNDCNAFCKRNCVGRFFRFYWIFYSIYFRRRVFGTFEQKH